MRPDAPFTLALLAALMAGCSLAAPPTGAAKGEPEARVSAKRRKPVPPPERVNLTLPASLGMVAAGGGNLVGPDGAALIGNDAGSLVAAGAGNMVAAGAGNYALLQDADCAPMPTGAKSFIPLVYLNSAAYVDAVMMANATLRAAREADPGSDEPFAVPLPGGGKGTAFFTARGETAGLLRVAAGPVFDASRLVLSLAYEAGQKGKLVYRAAEHHPAFGRLAIAMDFDLAAGRVSADGASDATVFPADKCGVRGPTARAHWEFRAPKVAGGPVFTMQVSANFLYADKPEDSGARGLVMHFDAKHRGAARMGRVLPGEAELKFTREDGLGYTADPAVPAAYFLGEAGTPLAAGAADEPLKALLPTLADFHRPFPADLAPGSDPLADPAFTFLE